MSSARNRKILAVVATDATYTLRDARGEKVWVGKCIFCGRALTLQAILVESILSYDDGVD